MNCGRMCTLDCWNTPEVEIGVKKIKYMKEISK